MRPHAIDWAILAVYFAFVLGIGAALKRQVRTSTDYFLSGRAIPAWITGLAFISANLGAQEVIGMAASGAKYGMATSHFYWMGAALRPPPASLALTRLRRQRLHLVMAAPHLHGLQPHGYRMVQHGHGTRLRPLLRILVY